MRIKGLENGVVVSVEIEEPNCIESESVPEEENEEQTTFTREEFNLLDIQKDGVIYTIYEEDGTVTTLKGVNR